MTVGAGQVDVASSRFHFGIGARKEIPDFKTGADPRIQESLQIDIADAAAVFRSSQGAGTV